MDGFNSWRDFVSEKPYQDPGGKGKAWEWLGRRGQHTAPPCSKIILSSWQGGKPCPDTSDTRQVNALLSRSSEGH